MITKIKGISFDTDHPVVCGGTCHLDNPEYRLDFRDAQTGAVQSVYAPRGTDVEDVRRQFVWINGWLHRRGYKPPHYGANPDTLLCGEWV